jgi:hypothetical protein
VIGGENDKLASLSLDGWREKFFFMMNIDSVSWISGMPVLRDLSAANACACSPQGHAREHPGHYEARHPPLSHQQ